MNCCYLRCLLVSSSNFVLSVGKNEIYVFQFRDFRTGSFYEMHPLIYQNMPDFSVLFSAFRVFFVIYFAFYHCFFSILCISVLPFSFITLFSAFCIIFFLSLSSFLSSFFFLLKIHFSLRISQYIAHFVLNTHFTCRHAPKSSDCVLLLIPSF